MIMDTRQNVVTTKPIFDSNINKSETNKEINVFNQLSAIDKSEDDDIDVELESVSIQITNFNNSFEDESEIINNKQTLSNNQAKLNKSKPKLESKKFDDSVINGKNLDNIVEDKEKRFNNNLNSENEIKKNNINSEENLKLIKELEDLKSKVTYL